MEQDTRRGLPVVVFRRRKRRGRNNVSYCRQVGCRGVRNCRECRNIWSRSFRTPWQQLTDEQRRKSNCRAYTKMLIRRGVLVPGLCEDRDTSPCAGAIEPHHDDYTKPREVRWKCREHHRAFHRQATAEQI